MLFLTFRIFLMVEFIVCKYSFFWQKKQTKVKLSQAYETENEFQVKQAYSKKTTF